MVLPASDKVCERTWNPGKEWQRYQFIQMFLVFPLQLSVEMRNCENSWFQVPSQGHHRAIWVPGTGRNVRETVSAPLLVR